MLYALSDKEGNGGGEEAGPRDLSHMSHLVISGEELDAVDVAVVLHLTVHLVSEEGLHGIVELVLVHVASDVADEVVGPVGMLNTV